MSKSPKKRSAIAKTFLALEHHAKPLRDVAAAISMMALAGNFYAESARGGSNSWNLRHPDGRWFSLRARRNPWRIEVLRHGTLVATFQTRLDAIKWFENV